MKTVPVLLLMALTIHLLFVLHHCDAIQGDSGGSPPPPNEKSVKTAAEVKDKKGDLKESPSKMKDKRPETKADESKGKGDSGSELEAAHVEDSGVEECDPSNRCIDEKNKFVACLRVPGKDSLDLSLLIQNKGTLSVDVNIFAPSFVKLEEATVRLQPKGNKEVKVSVQDGANDTVIILKAGEGNCSLDFRNMISNTVRSETSAFFGNARLSARSSLVGIVMTATVLCFVALLCIKCRRMNQQEGGPSYQKVEMGIPVSSGGKKEADEEESWGGGWDESWDEEAAPMTPSSLVSNPSSKGLASRKSNKDGWKD